MRLIDAGALIRHKRKMSGADFGGEFWDDAVLASDIKNAPTVDAAPVVWCRDCIHSYEEFGFIYCTCELSVHGIVPPDFYCACGKRRSAARGVE